MCFAPFRVFHGDNADIGLVRLVEDVTEVGIHAEMVGEHHHIEAARVDRCVGDLFEVRRVGTDTEKPHLALFLQAVECFVDVWRHQAVESITRVNMDEVDIVGMQPLQAALDSLDDLGNRRFVAQVSVRDAELCRQEQILAPHVLDGETELVLGPVLGVIGSRVEIVDAALDRQLRYFAALKTTGTDGDVGNHRVGATQAALFP